MAAIQGTRISSSVAGIFVVGISAALLVGAAGGYSARGLGSAGSATTQVQGVHPAPGTVLRQDNPKVALPDQAVHAAPGTVLRQDNPKAELPVWATPYRTTAPWPQFKIDELIESLSYAAPLTSGAGAGDETTDSCVFNRHQAC